jgi:secreted PhoX family phosphatase
MVGAGRVDDGTAASTAPQRRPTPRPARGQGVFHTKFGEGVIVTLEGQGDDARAPGELRPPRREVAGAVGGQADADHLSAAGDAATIRHGCRSPALRAATHRCAHAYSTNGSAARGTLNNCGTGKTPWGTLLTGEENWAATSRAAPPTTRRAQQRQERGLAQSLRPCAGRGQPPRLGERRRGRRLPRWNISKTGASADGSDDFRNELNTFGYLVEIDPYDPGTPFRKRTSLGRFAHESAAFSLLTPGKPLAVYMGDDSRGEYMYKLVCAAKLVNGDAQRGDRIATGDKYLDAGKLYVARFSADGSGEWIELSMTDPAIAGYAGYCVRRRCRRRDHTRLAADAVGATKMDRPEWCATHPETGEVYYTLTNNSNRKVEPSGTSQQRVDAANPRSYSDRVNAVRRARRATSTATSSGCASTTTIRGDAFKWDVYLFGAEAAVIRRR